MGHGGRLQLLWAALFGCLALLSAKPVAAEGDDPSSRVINFADFDRQKGLSAGHGLRSRQAPAFSYRVLQMKGGVVGERAPSPIVIPSFFTGGGPFAMPASADPMLFVAPPRRTSRRQPASLAGGPRSQAYCVRQCDGFFFPAGPALRGKGVAMQQSYCHTVCPAADMALYTLKPGTAMDEAKDAKGEAYQMLKAAFQFRSQKIAGCGCRPEGGYGLAQFPIHHDMTLRRGDLIAGDAGILAFRGASRFPYASADFIAARSYSRLPPDTRRLVARLEQGRSYGEPGRLSALRGPRLPVLVVAAEAAPPAIAQRRSRMMGMRRAGEGAIAAALRE